MKSRRRRRRSERSLLAERLEERRLLAVTVGTYELLTHADGGVGLSSGGVATTVEEVLSHDRGVVAFSTVDASRFGNPGESFSDGAPEVADLLVSDAANGLVQLVTRGPATSTASAGVGATYKGMSPDARYVVFASSEVTSFGNQGTAFVDSEPTVVGASSDLFVFDRADSSIRLVTAGPDATTSRSKSASFVGITADSRFVIFTTNHAESIGSFTAPGKQPGATDVIAYNLATGEQLLLSHSASDATATLSADVGEVMLSADGQFVLFTAANASLFGNDGVAFTDSQPTAADLFAVRIETGEVSLLSRAPQSSRMSAGEAVSLVGVSPTGKAVFSAKNASRFGSNGVAFVDAATVTTDYLSADLANGDVRLLSTNGTIGTSAASDLTVEGVFAGHLYFTTPDATAFGASSDDDPAAASLLRADLATGVVELLSHGRTDDGQALLGSVVSGSVDVTDDGRHVAFAITVAKGTASGGFTFAQDGDALMITDGQTSAIRIVNSSDAEGTRLSYGAWADVANLPRVFSGDSRLVWQSNYLHWVNSLDAPETNNEGNGVVVFDFSAGLAAAGIAQPNMLLSHSTTSLTDIGDSNSQFVGVSPDGRLAFFTADDARWFGNAGVAFSDGQPTIKDLFAVDLVTQQIGLVSGNGGTSLGSAATFLGSTDAGGVIFFATDVDGLLAPAGPIIDTNAAALDVISAGFSLLDLVTSDDTTGGDEGLATDNITSNTDFTLQARVQAGQQVTLLDNGVAVETREADALGVVSWALAGVSVGNHVYSVQDSASQTAVEPDAALALSTLTVTVVPDRNPPTLLSSAPVDNTLEVPLDVSLALTFSEAVRVGSGDITLVRDDGTSQAFNVTGTAVSVSGATVTVAFGGLEHSHRYHVLVDAGALTDLSGNAFAGIAESTVLNFATVDGTPPVFTSPATIDVREAVSVIYTAVAVDSVFASTGVLTYSLDPVSADAALLQVDSATGAVSLRSGVADRAAKSSYVFTVVAADASGNAASQAVTVTVDPAPALLSSTPGVKATNVSLTSNIVLTYSEAVYAGSGELRLYDNDATLVETFAVGGSRVTFAGATVTIDPTADFSPDMVYYLISDATAVVDTIGNPAEGIQALGQFVFSTGQADAAAPKIVSASPAADSVDMPVDAPIVITFDEAVRFVGGSITVQAADNSYVEWFDVGISDRAIIDGKTLTITPTWSLPGSTDFFVTIDSVALRDAWGNQFAGITDGTTYRFRTGVETTGSYGASAMEYEFPGMAEEHIGDYTVLYIRATYPDTLRSPTTLLQAQNDMHDFTQFHVDSSRGKLTATVTYTPVITLPFPMARVEGLGEIHQSARDEARLLGFDPDAYEVVIVRVDGGLKDGFSWGGGDSGWLGWAGTSVAIHEAGGHALSMSHANKLDPDTGDGVSYGNSLDVMGSGDGFEGQYSLYHKLNRWLDSTQIHSERGSGNFRIYPLDQGYSVAGEKYGLQVTVPSDQYGLSPDGLAPVYTLEYRPSQGGELLSSAVVLRNDLIIDLTPDTREQLDAGIRVGHTYRAPGSDSYFSVTDVGDGFLDVAVRIGPFSGNHNPSGTLTGPQTVAAGEAITFTADGVDEDGDQLIFGWSFSDGVFGGGRSFTRTFEQAVGTTVDVTLTISDMRGGSVTHTLAVTVSADGTGTPVSVGTLAAPSFTTPLVSLEATRPVATEGGLPGLLTLTRLGTSLDSPLTVNLQYAGSALQQFADLPSSLTIPAGASSVSLVLTPIDDGVIDSDDWLTVTIASSAGYVPSDWNASASVQFVDDDAPVVTIDVVDGVATEGGRDLGAAMVHRTGPVDLPLTVYYVVSGTAENGKDYTRHDGTVVIPAGQATAILPVVPLDDDAGERTESVTFSIASFVENYNVGPAHAATVEIRDNADKPVINVGVRDRSYGAFAGPTMEGREAHFVFTVVGGDGSPVTVQYALSGTATPGSDYTGLTGSVELPTGEVQVVEVPVSVILDSLAEDSETIVVSLLSGSSYSIGIDAQATLGIFEDVDYDLGDDSLQVTKTYGDPKLVPAEAGDAMKFTILHGGYSNNLEFTYRLSGSATPGVDYVGHYEFKGSSSNDRDFTPGTINTVQMPSGAYAVVVTLTPVDDALVEGVETVTLALESAQSNGHATIKWNRSASYEITDNDFDGVLAGFETAESFVAEADEITGTILEVPVVLSGVLPEPITVGYFPTGGSALAGGVDWAFLDMTANAARVTSGTITIAAGETRGVITLWVQNDRVLESMETIGIGLAPTGAGLDPARSSHVVNVYDVLPGVNDVALPSADNRYVWFAAGQTLVTEGGEQPAVLVTLDRANLLEAITVDVVATTASTAAAGSDYSLTKTITFAPGEVSKRVPLTILTDGVVEGVEAVRLELTNARGALIVTPSSSSVVILDAAAPLIEAAAGVVSANTPEGSLVTTATATVAAGRAVASWAIVGGNPALEGSATPAFAIDADGRITLANAAAVPFSTTTIALVLRVTDDEGNVAESPVDIVINGRSLFVERWEAFLGSTVYKYATWGTPLTGTDILDSFDQAPSRADDYSTRVTGVFEAPETGYYSFWVAGDDSVRLKLGLASQADEAAVIAAASTSTSYQSWFESASQASGAIELTAGTRYVLSLEHSDSSGRDHFSVAWSGPGFGLQVMPSSAFIPLYGAARAAEPPQLGSTIQALNTFSIDDSAVTDSGVTATVAAGGVTRDPTLGLSGVADAGSRVSIYEGPQKLGEVVSDGSGQWAFTTPELADGDHAFWAEVVSEQGSIGITQPKTFTIRSAVVIDPMPILLSYGASRTETSAGVLVEDVVDVDQGLIIYRSGGELYAADATTAAMQLISRGFAAADVGAGATVTYGTTSPDGRYVVFGSNQVTRFGQNGQAFTDTAGTTSGPYSDIFVFDRDTATVRLATAGATSTTSRSTQSQVVGVTADSRYLIYTTSNIGGIGGFTASVGSLKDVVAYDLETGEQRLLTHTAADAAVSFGGDVSDVTVAGEGSRVFFTALDASRLGNGGAAFTDAAPTAADLFAVDASTGEITLVTRSVASATASAGVAVTLSGVEASTGNVLFAAADATAFGFTDPANTTNDLFYADVDAGELKLITHSGSGTASAGKAFTLLQSDRGVVFFSAADATGFGAFTDDDTTKASLLRWTAASGVTTLLSHHATDPAKALSGAFVADSLAVSPSGRFVAFGIDVKSSTSSGGFTFQRSGHGVFVTDLETNILRLANSSDREGTTLSYGAWADAANNPIFVTDAGQLIWQQSYLGWVNTVSGAQDDDAIVMLDFTDGLAAPGTSQPNTLLSHSPSSLLDLPATAATSLQGVSPDGRFAYFTAADASLFGNNGVAFVDGATSTSDLFAVDLATQEILLLSGQAGVSLEGSAVLAGLPTAGGALVSLGNVNGLSSIGGSLTDTNGTQADVIAYGSSIIDLSRASDSLAGGGSRTDNITDARTVVINTRVMPNMPVELLLNGQVVATETADPSGVILWTVSGLTVGEHLFTLRHGSEQVPLVAAAGASASTLRVTVVEENGGNSWPTDVELTPAVVNENSAVGTTVGTFSTTDPDTGDTFRYDLVAGAGDTDNASFAIVGGALQTGVAFDFETKDSYSIRVESTDAGGLAVEKVFTISVTDINEAPTGVSLSNTVTTLNEGTDTSARVKVADIVIADDALGTNGITLTGADAGRFEVDGTELFLTAGVTLDFETQSSYSVTINLEDSTVVASTAVTVDYTLDIIPQSPHLTTGFDGQLFIDNQPVMYAGSPVMASFQSWTIFEAAVIRGQNIFFGQHASGVIHRLYANSDWSLVGGLYGVGSAYSIYLPRSARGPNVPFFPDPEPMPADLLIPVEISGTQLRIDPVGQLYANQTMLTRQGSSAGVKLTDLADYSPIAVMRSNSDSIWRNTLLWQHRINQSLIEWQFNSGWGYQGNSRVPAESTAALELAYQFDINRDGSIG